MPAAGALAAATPAAVNDGVDPRRHLAFTPPGGGA